MAWVHGVLAAVSLAVGLLHLGALARRRDTVLEASYAAMSLGMAAMYSPFGDPVPASVWVALFLLCAGWFGGVMLRARSVDALGGDAMHLAVGSAAMLFMIGADHGSGEHPAHATGAPGMAGVASAVALALAAYFVLHMLRCVDRLRAARLAAPSDVIGRGAGDTPVRTATALRVPAPAHCSRTVPPLAHLLLTGVMAVMLIGMI